MNDKYIYTTSYYLPYKALFSNSFKEIIIEGDSHVARINN